MNITPELLIAVTGLLAGIGAFYNSRRSARKDELNWLREEVARLHGRVQELEEALAKRDREVEFLREEKTILVGMLRDQGVEI